jgi:outer membrane protein
MKAFKPTLVLAISMLAATATAQVLPDDTAADAPPPPRSGEQLRWSLGLGVISSPRPYVGANNSILPIPLIELYYKKLYVQGIQAGYHFIDTERFTLDAQAAFVFAGLDPDDSPALEGMEKRQPTIEGGLVFDWKPGKYKLSTTAYSDLLGRSKGQQVGLDFSRAWTFDNYRWGLTPSIGFVWQSSSYVDYYYGVAPGEARPDRPEFSGQAVVNFRSSVFAFYRLTMRVTLVGLVQVQRLDNEIFDSPIVDKRRGYFGLVGVTYLFGELPGRP